MDKRFLQSIGLTIGMPRWKAYLLMLVFSITGAIGFWLFCVITIGLFGG